MPYKTDTQPLCRTCAKPIKKFTMIHWAHVKDPNTQHAQFNTEWSKTHILDAPIYTRADCQKLTNHRVISLKHSNFGEDRTRIRSFGTWDGESYVDEFFCSGSCARAFGYMAARHGDIQTMNYVRAMRKAGAKP